MSNIWFTSDTHFGHKAIIDHCYRGFASVKEMDEELMCRWNSVVKDEDTVYHLGDFTLLGAEAAENYLEKLHGDTIHLIWGNHDRNSVRKLPYWNTSQPMKEISIDGIHITLCHYAMRVWNGSHRGSLMFYGHSHDQLKGNNQSLDVGVDGWDFYPVSFDAIKQRLQENPPYIQEDFHK